MTKEIYGTLIKHEFEVHAAQAAEDKVAIEAQGYFAPDVFYKNNPEGLWAAHELSRYIRKMGYDAEIALDPIEDKKHGSCLHLQVGIVPQNFLEDIKDFISMREIQQGKDKLVLFMADNGHYKQNHETTMMTAFKQLKAEKGRDNPGINKP
ncbi:MAG TPA: hypothetical protein VGD95_03210 [Micavibrio sp.]